MIDKENYSKEAYISRKRHALWYWLYNRVGLNKSEIAEIFGLHHSTIINGISKAREFPEDILIFTLDTTIKKDILALIESRLSNPETKGESQCKS